jgi:hypothetical protein
MDFIPFAWPGEWTDPAALKLLENTPVNTVIVENKQKLAAVVQAGESRNLKFFEKSAPPAGVELIKGVWPGIRISKDRDNVSGGPTGAPWVDSNGWSVQLARAQKPGKSIWVWSEIEKNQVVRPEMHILAVADAASRGGVWLASFTDELRKGVEVRSSEAMSVWQRMTASMAFFAARLKQWSALEIHGVLGVVSDFSGGNEFMSTEVLNLTARQNQPYKILEKGKLTDASLKGLVAVIYPDDEAPTPELRKRLLAFVDAGGVLIAGPKWGEEKGPDAGGDPHPRFSMVRRGKGRIAVAREFDDPFLVASDSRILMSHRYDLVRFWNSGSLCANILLAADGKRAIVHMINYATRPGRDLLSCRIAGPWRSAKFLSVEKPEPAALETVREKDALELHLPAIPVYGAVDLVA